jgi:hypothetical protein
VTHSETLETSGNYRVRLEVEEGPEEPYDDTQSPLLRIDLVGYTPKAEHIASKNSRPVTADAQVEEAARRWGGPNSSDWPKFERYLRAFHGVTQIVTYWSGSDWYVTYDSAEWREAVGAPEGDASLEEYRSWCEGEVYGYVIEKRVTWATVDEAYDDMTTWEPDGDDASCWGFYGYDYAKSAALSEFKAHLEGAAS